jgi:peptidoglycan/LPS O-acetylase OafA/YrhL
MALLTALVAIGIADVCHRFVELPMIERGRSLSQKQGVSGLS